MALIYGIGTDIVSIARMEQALTRFGRRFAERILSAAELQEFDACARPAALLAKRFAVKEAVAKAFGTGFRDGLRLQDIQVGHDSRGRPELHYRGAAQALARTNAVTASHVSIADERDYAIAYVILLADGK
ncbi:holo-[acyl-carrier-protein] synthase [Thiohalobacter sp. COW1]|uniref:Holo-[acyl-carrier-protein] synthase n=1 Tax=Thiohalobacter thiocyanaticus TaxID=585455 RepID=A0A1Z4VPR3_9GAMM|nr:MULTISPECIES: holo-ACP synthase [Thiohalobacter]BAZ93473.1 phosphopantetheinyl transferase [Thiohalobacter thiocyanaticus]BCO31485.1 holo-[acyl-carrier-protein] synthase [Thiohalobacter sp. COW1]